MPPEPLTRADVLTASEASALLGIPRSTLYELARRGALPARQIGRRWIFRRSLLDRATLPQSEPESWATVIGDEQFDGRPASGRRRLHAQCPRSSRRLATSRAPAAETFGLRRAISGPQQAKPLPANVARSARSTLLQTQTAPFAGPSSKRTTGVEPATFGLGSQSSTN